MSFGSKLRDLRKERQLSQTDLGNELGLSCTAISQYELDNRFPDRESLVSICNFFNISADFLLEISSVRSAPIKDAGIMIDCKNFDSEQMNTLMFLVQSFKTINSGDKNVTKR